MNFSDTLQEVFWAIAGNKVRSALTILGIVIGIASVIALISLGQGAKNSISQSIQSIGSNLIMITPGASRGGFGLSAGRGSAQTLTQDDANAIKSTLTDINGVAPEVSRRYQITAGGQNTNTQVTGTVPDYTTVRNVSIDTGSFISDTEVGSVAKVAVLGPTTASDLFSSGTEPIGQAIRINNINFKVIGVTMSKGGSGFTNADDVIYIPITTAQHYLAGGNFVSIISVSAQDQNSISTVQSEITTLLLARHKISDPQSADFSTLNQSDIVSTASSITSTLTTLLAGIAGISLLVGGIGIMNMMLTTVTERTREIGLRKAIGAKRSDIVSQFLYESITLTFFGGAIGIILGWALSLIVNHFTSLPSAITWQSVLLAFGVSAAVGIIFGYYPARRAAGLNPIEALRYE